MLSALLDGLLTGIANPWIGWRRYRAQVKPYSLEYFGGRAWRRNLLKKKK